jgi:preprotein translocase subunit SecD
MIAVAPLLAQANDDAGALAGGIGLVCVALIALLVYFLPAVVAGFRGHQNTAAIFILNLLLGWSFIGWVVALVWAFTEVRRDYQARY